MGNAAYLYMYDGPGVVPTDLKVYRGDGERFCCPYCLNPGMQDPGEQGSVWEEGGGQCDMSTCERLSESNRRVVFV